jgi:hypothetical protein
MKSGMNMRREDCKLEIELGRLLYLQQLLKKIARAICKMFPYETKRGILHEGATVSFECVGYLF